VPTKAMSGRKAYLGLGLQALH